MKKGKIFEHKDTYLSPINLEIEE
ncbi:hypothetical protein [Phocoenobacter skyensis]